MTYQIAFVSLGCAKNQVNCEQMMAAVQAAGHTVRLDPDGADVAVVNTCGFLASACQEAIDTILELAEPNDPALRREMEAAFSPDMLLFGQDGLEVFFPRGSLPSQEYGFGFYVACEWPLADILQDWALPVSPAAG